MNIIDVARYIVHLSYQKEQYSLTPLKLQKILYYTQGWSYAWDGRPLFTDSFEAWRYGPVNRDVYNYFKEFHGEEIPENAGMACPPSSAEERETIKAVWKAYGSKSASQLVEMTHQEPPWYKAYESNGKIRNSDIKKYFVHGM